MYKNHTLLYSILYTYDKMKLKITDIEKISRTKCMIKGCKNKSYAMVKQMFLCEEHFRKRVPEKSPSYMRRWGKF
ncbi:hypothetical protein LCGC14_0791980 [marine sediment metagenome]|uniref:Uncharacterized protein n=1 Tax=marine sediment metagenome TaxID=412755 RepID=A0A0F9SZC9_9ZZZZ